MVQSDFILVQQSCHRSGFNTPMYHTRCSFRGNKDKSNVNNSKKDITPIRPQSATRTQAGALAFDNNACCSRRMNNQATKSAATSSN
jgi:hypothetical protein